MYKECINNVYNENKGFIWSNLFLTLLIYPIEILLLSWLSGMIFFNQKNVKKFWFFICMFFLAFILIMILKYVREMIDTKIIPSINTNVRLDLFDKTTNKKVGIQSIENGELLIKLQNLPYFIYSGYINSMTFIIPFILTFIAFAAFLFYINWKIGLFSLFYMISYFLLIGFFYLKICKLSYQRHVCEVNQSNEFVDILRNNENISLHNTFKTEKERLSSKEDDLQKSFRKELRFISLYRLSIIVLISVYAFIVIFMGYLFVKNNLHYQIINIQSR
jgi:ABC-type multidrug transport system fused ATPase/permease subunit